MDVEDGHKYVFDDVGNNEHYVEIKRPNWILDCFFHEEGVRDTWLLYVSLD
jgi:hypothetical protein